MIRVTAPSRLHFGLFRLPSEKDDYWPDLEGKLTVPARHFGGIGLMIDRPGVRISIEHADSWSATGPSAERALAFARQFMHNSPELPPQAFQITVEHCASEHVGLGTGTQLGLAVAKALAFSENRRDWDAVELARRLGRGLRSGIGIHGFEHGGFLVDGGKTRETRLAPLVARHAFPEDWSVLLLVPQNQQGVHGFQEGEAFAQLARSETASTHSDAMCRLALLGILPALLERDLAAFGEALYDFNRRAGEMFRPLQGGIYANPVTADVIAFMRKQGVKAVGQSSWGPAVFAIDREEALGRLQRDCRARFGLSAEEVMVTKGYNAEEKKK